jgi:hypothetical protein
VIQWSNGFFGVWNGVLITDSGFSGNVIGNISMTRNQFYDAYIFGKQLPQNTHPIMKLFAQAIASP